MTEDQGRTATPVIGLVGLAFLLMACATPYQPRSLTGGFSDTRLDTPRRWTTTRAACAEAIAWAAPALGD
jgi:hypothetical protein